MNHAGDLRGVPAAGGWLVGGGEMGRVIRSMDWSKIAWSTKLPGGTDFVTVTGEGTHIYAASGGQLHCLDIASGRILWTNGLKGYGYRVASLWLPGATAAPSTAAYEGVRSEQDSGGGGVAVSGS